MVLRFLVKTVGDDKLRDWALAEAKTVDIEINELKAQLKQAQDEQARAERDRQLKEDELSKAQNALEDGARSTRLALSQIAALKARQESLSDDLLNSNAKLALAERNVAQAKQELKPTKAVASPVLSDVFASAKGECQRESIEGNSYCFLSGPGVGAFKAADGRLHWAAAQIWGPTTHGLHKLTHCSCLPK